MQMVLMTSRAVADKNFILPAASLILSTKPKMIVVFMEG
jgi:hypothetical protein